MVRMASSRLPRRHRSAEQITVTAREMYEAKMPIKQIARKLNFSEQHTRRILKSQGYEPNRIGGTRICYEKAFLAAEMDLQGYSWNTISKEIGHSYKALKRAIKYYAAQSTE